jgi:hypothetical protein
MNAQNLLNPLIRPLKRSFQGFRPGIARALLIWAAATGLLLDPFYSRGAASFQDSGGFLVMEAENFDLNVTRPTGFFEFDNVNPITAFSPDYISGWGYMKEVYSGGTDMNASPRMDYKVNFTSAGNWYIWVLGSDMGGKALSVGLDGTVPVSATDIGGKDNVFGTRGGGALNWDGTNNMGFGYTNQAYLTVPTAGEHTINVFIREAGLYLDRFCLTTSSWDTFVPTPMEGGTNSGLNVPLKETLAPSATLQTILTQPANNQVLSGATTVPFAISAKAITNGTPVSKIEFFSKLATAASFTKIGEKASKPYMLSWSNSPIGTNLLMAVTTDSLNNRATGAVVTVARVLPAPGTPLAWKTNTFDSGLGSFTLLSHNHDGGLDLDWRNSAYAGGPPGELGGLIVRRQDMSPYVAEPLFRSVALNEDLWFRGSLTCSNIDAGSDFFIGFFDNVGFARMGLKIREPSGGPFRISVEPGGVKLTPTLASATTNHFDIHWIPNTNFDGTTDGSGTLYYAFTGDGVSDTTPGSVSYSAANGVAFNAFGLLAPAQGSTDTRSYYVYLDNVEYTAPVVPILYIQKIGNNAVLSWSGLLTTYSLQYTDTGLTTPTWYTNSNSVLVGDTYYATNTIGATPRFYRLKQQ